jgi:ribosomal protein S2
MKLKKFKFKQILKLHLLNSRAYAYASKKANLTNRIDFNLAETLTELKKVLHIIFEYHQANKKILFVGLPKKLEKIINSSTCHVAVDSKFKLQGFTSKHLNTSKFSMETRHLSSDRVLLPKLLKNPSLIVILAHDKSLNIVKESSVAKIPTVIFGSNNGEHIDQIKSVYSLKGFEENLDFTSGKTLFYLGLQFLFNNQKRKPFPYKINQLFQIR